jgi:hypothetical protein
MAFEVESEDFVEALRSATIPTDLADAMGRLVVEVLTRGQENRKLQDCLAGLLREEGWTCTAPVEPSGQRSGATAEEGA